MIAIETYLGTSGAASVVTQDIAGTNIQVSPTSGKGNVTINAGGKEAVNTVSTSGSVVNLPATTSYTVNDITLTSASVTLNFPTAAVGEYLTNVLRQDNTGGRVVLWPATVKWPNGGVAPTLTSASVSVDVTTHTCTDGTNWLSFVSGLNLR